MDNNIVLTSQQMLDIFFRFATTGTLSLLFIFVSTDTNRTNKAASLGLISCLIGYVLLTAPVEDAHYGLLRPPLLLLTNCTTYALLAVYWHRVHGVSLVSALPKWSLPFVAAWFAWHAYFFLIKEGIGVFHTLHDGIGLMLLVVIVVDAIRGLNDDLVASRRDLRKLAITFISVYVLVLTIIEVFFRPLKDDGIFSLTNALFMLVCASYFAYRTLQQTISQRAAHSPDDDKIEPAEEAQLSASVVKLKQLMDQGIYTQNGLTIAKLASEMALPEHQLRVVINQQLGFENFSQFLNSYRIPAVCKKLQQTEHQNTPILTLALDTGYNSIAPFNRAFKELKGITPTQYRQDHSARLRTR